MGLGHSPQIVKNGLVLLLDAANKKSYPAAGSLYFDGSGDYLTILANSAFGFGTGDFTIEYWWYPTRNSGIEIMVDTRPSNIAGPFVVLGKNSDGSVFCYEGTVRTGGSMTLNAWNHVAWCRNGTSNVVYLNGTSVISFTSGFDAGTSRGLTIGANASPAFENCQGYINDLRITKGIARYTGNFTPPQLIDHLTDQYKSSVSLLLKATDGIKDYSDNSFPITIVGNTTISTQTNVTTWTDLSGKGNNGTLVNGTVFNNSDLGDFVFDGNNDCVSLPLNILIPHTGNPFSISLWFKTSSAGILLGQQNTNTPGNATSYVPGVYVDTTGKLRTSCFWAGNTSTTLSSINVTNNTWFNVTITFASTIQKVYINGVFSEQITKSQVNYSSTYYYFLGNGVGSGWPNIGNTPFNGKISNFAIYTKELTSTEVLQNFNALRGRYGI